MRYPSPEAGDFIEIRALNTAFLQLLRRGGEAVGGVSALPAELVSTLLGLGDEDMERLARTPFFLFSLRESDDGFWETMHRGGGTRCLFDRGRMPGPETTQLVSAALGFIWQMARQNPYTLRISCFSSLHWAERIAEQPLVALIDRAASAEGILCLRASDDHRVWQRLLAAAAETDPGVRSALLATVLQTLLVKPTGRPRKQLPSAACRVDLPTVSLTADD